MRGSANSLASTTKWGWQQAPVGPAGFAMGWRGANDDSWQLTWNDVGGGYRRSGWSDRWSPRNILLELGATWRFPQAITNIVSGVGVGHGIYDADISRSNTAYGYFLYAGRLFQTTNRALPGSFVEKTAFTPRILLANYAIAKHLPGRLIIDPSDHLSVFIGLPDEASVYTRDGGDTFTTIATLPAPNAAVYQYRGDRCVLFAADHTSALVGGRRSKWTAAVMGAGLYESTDAGATWTAVAGSPKHVTCMCYDGQGRLYFVAYGDTYTADAVNPTTVRGAFSGANSGYYYRQSGTTTGPLTGLGFSSSARYVSVNPTNDNDICFSDGQGSIRFTSARPTSATLTSWGTWPTSMITTIAKDRPMIAYEHEIQLGLGSHNCPSYSHDGTKIGIPGGYTFMYLVRSEVPASQIAWLKLYEDGAGTEILVSQGGAYVQEPDGSFDGFVGVCQDRGFIHLAPSPGNGRPRPACRVTSTWVTSVIINQGSSASWHPSAPDYQCILGGSGKIARRNATDRNKWDEIWSGPMYSGSIAVLGQGKVLYLPANNQQPTYTDNDGATWSPCLIGGSPPALQGGISGWGWHGINGPIREAVCNDPDVPGAAYLYNYISPLQGLYETLDGINLSRVSGADYIIDPLAVGYSLELKMGGGVMYLITGYSGSGYQPQNNSVVGKRSFDKGRTWSSWGQGTQIICMAIGAPMPWTTNKTIYACMFVGSTFGLWYSTDNATSFTLIEDAPPIALFPNKIAAHPVTPGKIMLSIPGFGWVEGDVSLALGLR